MKLSEGFWQTYKEFPSEATIPSHQLMLRAGLIHKSQAGLYNFLPMGLRSLRKVENIVREEMNKIGAMEICMTIVTPGELWQESGRWDAMEGLMLKIKDRAGRDICLSPTNEEMVVDIFRKTVKSYKQLPLSLYQINTKFRDEIRPRFGIMRAREFLMKDAYSFHENWESLEKVYQDYYRAYTNCFKRMGLRFMAVEADAGAMGDSRNKTHEFQVLATAGEDKVIVCKEAGYAANLEKAQTRRKTPDFNLSGDPVEMVETGQAETIEDISEFLSILPHQCLKCLVYKGITGNTEEILLAVLLGDDQLNEIKLKNKSGHEHLKAISTEELGHLGIYKGQIGPLKLGAPARIIFDKAINMEAAYVTGANRKGHHFTMFVPKRDMEESFEMADIRLSQAGDFYNHNGMDFEVEEVAGIEVGHIFQLGDKYTKSLCAKVLDKNGKEFLPLMGCYGIGVSRIVAAAIEQNHDENGIIWPLSIAPYQIYFVILAKSPGFVKVAEEIYEELQGQGIEVLLDDREGLSAGNKFKDSDLLGLPLRLVLGERDFSQDQVLELKVRKTGEVKKIKLPDLLSAIKEHLK
jgi:prolyl-tRNA synthetase